MRVGIIADVHSNLEALQSVWQLFDAEKVDTVWCLGDIVGYGANPSECIAEVKSRCSVILKGNHDEASATLQDLDWFNEWARQAALWTHYQLSEQEISFLESLPASRKVNLESSEVPVVWLVHGSFREPLTEYILNAHIAAENLGLLVDKVGKIEKFPTLLFFGHSHVAETYFLPSPRSRKMRHQRFLVTTDFQIQSEGVYLINVGSVGQPRDGNPYAACGILDTKTLTLRVFRIPYDVERAAVKIIRAGLPQELALRLFQGW
ncbi:MAG: metallophosphatase family protein [Armatimonadetes bacterium]|nr:metallophosphatase family protein [Armatimonadota bacterium]MCX7967457.1 metallophosphatase family protein [Armatimonadota bacterium]MDW8143737.1 metallophosphoesterase family protein [Armatimonadota bacterium]